MVPKTATPMDPPIDRKNVTELVAVPSSLKGTEFCTARIITCMVRPMPVPTIAM